MSIAYSWEGIRQVRATLLGARHVHERFCGGYMSTWGAISSVRPLLTDRHIDTSTDNGLLKA